MEEFDPDPGSVVISEPGSVSPDTPLSVAFPPETADEEPSAGFDPLPQEQSDNSRNAAINADKIFLDIIFLLLFLLVRHGFKNRLL